MGRTLSHGHQRRSAAKFESRHSRANANNGLSSSSTPSSSPDGNVFVDDSRSFSTALLIGKQLHKLGIKSLIELILLKEILPDSSALMGGGFAYVKMALLIINGIKSIFSSEVSPSLTLWHSGLAFDFVERYFEAIKSDADLTPFLQEINQAEAKYPLSFSIIALCLHLINLWSEESYGRMAMALLILLPTTLKQTMSFASIYLFEEITRLSREKLNEITLCANIKWCLQPNMAASTLYSRTAVVFCPIPPVLKLEYQSENFSLDGGEFANEFKFLFEKAGAGKLTIAKDGAGYQLQAEISSLKSLSRFGEENLIARLYRIHYLKKVIAEQKRWLHELVGAYTSATWEENYMLGNLDTLPDYTLSLHTSQLSEEFRNLLLAELGGICGDALVAYDKETQVLKIQSVFALGKVESNACKALQNTLKDYTNSHPVLSPLTSHADAVASAETFQVSQQDRVESIKDTSEGSWLKSVSSASAWVSSWFRRTSVVAQAQPQAEMVKWPDGKSYPIYDKEMAPDAKVFRAVNPGGAAYYFKLNLTEEEFGGGEKEYQSFVNTLARGHFGGGEGEKGIVIKGDECKLKIPNKNDRVIGGRIGSGNFFELTAIENHNHLKRKGFGKY